MKKAMFLLFVFALALAGAAEATKVAPTQAVIDLLVFLGADEAAITEAQAKAPEGALFLAPGAVPAAAYAKLESIVRAGHSSDADIAKLGYCPHCRLNSTVFESLLEQVPSGYYDEFSMQLGDIVWTVSNKKPKTD